MVIHMKLSENELKILRESCNEYGVEYEALKSLFIAEEEVYFLNESQANKIVTEMVKILKFWALKTRKGSE